MPFYVTRTETRSGTPGAMTSTLQGHGRPNGLGEDTGSGPGCWLVLSVLAGGGESTSSGMAWTLGRRDPQP